MGSYPHIHRLVHPLPGPYPLLPPPDLDKEGRVDNQRDTPPNTRLTVQPIRATSHFAPTLRRYSRSHRSITSSGASACRANSFSSSPFSILMARRSSAAGASSLTSCSVLPITAAIVSACSAATATANSITRLCSASSRLVTLPRRSPAFPLATAERGQPWRAPERAPRPQPPSFNEAGPEGAGNTINPFAIVAQQADLLQ